MMCSLPFTMGVNGSKIGAIMALCWSWYILAAERVICHDAIYKYTEINKLQKHLG